MEINLVDNSRYVLDKTDDSNYKKLKDSEFKQLKGLLKNNSFSLNDFDKVHLLNKPKENTDVLTLKNENSIEYIQTGNLVGTFYFKSGKSLYIVNIGLRFDKENDNSILEFLLDYTYSIYDNSINIGNKKSRNKSNKVIELLLTKMFINSLSKASVMGLPTIYQERYENSYNFSGRIDINRLLTQETPFKGKTPHIKNERVVVRSIASVILKAIDVLYFNTISEAPKDKAKREEYLKEKLSILSPLLQIKNTIKQSIKPQIITKKLINEALRHPALKHPAFYEYKNSVYIASLILEGFKPPKTDDIKGQSIGYLVDISRVWENFLVKLLSNNINDDWDIQIEPKLKLFKTRPNLNNLSNYMLPDIVVINENEKKVMVFDAKFKNSQWFNRDDFYKTTTYISYYQNQGYEVILSGQIYPDKNLLEINQNLGFLDSDIDFRLFGIDIKEEFLSKETKETEFINTIIDKINEKDSKKI